MCIIVYILCFPCISTPSSNLTKLFLETSRKESSQDNSGIEILTNPTVHIPHLSRTQDVVEPEKWIDWIDISMHQCFETGSQTSRET